MTDSPAPAVYKVSQLAKLLDMGRRQTYAAIDRGDIPCKKIGASVRCSKVAIHAWLDGGEPNEIGGHGSPVEVHLSGKQDWTQE